ncbi:asparaginase [Pseudomonas asuensis]|uniref:L-asparaginase 2 n=1 Tax=Pseudomonas asuensis TaxID=1825787 RepID=A0ABQ2GTF7_9PSED|nr:asparaginase [Pseudomonas asuensis]GGM09980.1 L-asparaginase 2 [Pseudomonas asuensis]
MAVRFASVFLGAALALSASPLFAADAKPSVVIYATGGTIAGSSASSTDTTDYDAGKLGIETLIKAVPELSQVATVTGEQLANMPSQDMDQKTLLKLSKMINEKFKDPAVHGVVVTHGTDTLEETAFFLDLTVNSKKPVVIVGAMRPATAVGADGPMNLLEAVSLAANDKANGRGTMVVLNDRISSAFYATKTNSTTPDTFRAAEQGYLGGFVGITPRFYYSPAIPTGKMSFDVSKEESLPKVVILYSYQDQDSALLDAAIKDGAKGIVIAGMGNGSIPTRTKATVKKLMEQGIPVIRSTRTGSGFVSKKEEGIGSGFFSPQKSRILLSLALASGADMAAIERYFGMVE